MLAQKYWNEVGSKKEFEDPLYIDKLRPFLSAQSSIVEYGCGYGRLGKILREAGYENYEGYDFAQSMIERGRLENPDLKLSLLEKPGTIPRHDHSVDVVVLSTVLCCMPNAEEQARLMEEILRVLKIGGVLYVTDFLICEHPMYAEKYEAGFQKYGERGVYTTSENLVVRHHTASGVLDLLNGFDVQWFEQFDFKTMNQNPAKTFHSIGRAK